MHCFLMLLFGFSWLANSLSVNSAYAWYDATRFQNVCQTSKLILTYAVAENDGQDHSYPHSDQGGALPGAVFRGLLEFESPSRQAVSGQRARRCGVNCPRCHGVTRGCCAKERCRSCARFKKKVPVEKKKKRNRQKWYCMNTVTVKWVMVQNSIPKVKCQIFNCMCPSLSKCSSAG